MWRDPTDDDSDRLEPCGELSPPLEREPAAERSGFATEGPALGVVQKGCYKTADLLSGLLYINAEAGWWTHFPRFFFSAYNVEFQRFES